MDNVVKFSLIQEYWMGELNAYDYWFVVHGFDINSVDWRSFATIESFIELNSE